MMILLLVLLISNHFDISSSMTTVCKSFPDYNHDSSENKIKCDKELIFVENTEENNQQNITEQTSATEHKITKLQEDLNEMNETIQATKEDVSEVSEEELPKMKSDLSKMVGRIVENLETSCFAGIKSKRVPDQSMSASSYAGDDYQAHYARLDNTGARYSYWQPKSSHAGYVVQWLQVDFGQETQITGVVTQGRPNWDEWVTEYEIHYGNSTTNLQPVKSNNHGLKRFQGNRDRNSHVRNYFYQPVTGRYFRLVVVSYNVIPVLRIEYLKC